MIRPVAAAVLFAFLCTACGTPSPPAATPPPVTASTTSTSAEPREHVLELEATGTATPVFTLTVDGKVTEEKPAALPWHKTISVPYGAGRHNWELSIRYTGGSVAARAMVDGKLATQTAGSGSPGSVQNGHLSGGFSD
ncbi:hypothetical protein [Amycolatopsis samaneae]|uniref:Lipoprotein n=1 Tax=Amycolatopsis samaneae TaxID=664691 RepID=A0ABW5GQ91_9PSEU